MIFLNGAHESIELTAAWSSEGANFLDVQVIKQGNKLVTDLSAKPTDTHQLCIELHVILTTKRGIPYSQALRIRRICSEEQFFQNRVRELKSWLLERCYSGNEVDNQIDRVRDKIVLLYWMPGPRKKMI